MSSSPISKEKETTTKQDVDFEVASINYKPSPDKPKKGAFGSFFDSFKPMDTELVFDPNWTEVERANYIASKAPLKRKLKSRHLQMISIGGAIGTGLFVGSGGALHKGGPAALLIAWILVGVMMYSTVHALGELAVAFPVSGAFVQYNSRFICPAWGFTMAWNYCLGWFVTLPLELVAASITIKYWNKEISSAAWVSIFYVAILCINFFGIKGYGEAEFIFSLIKVVAIIGYIILGIILCCGGGPEGGYVGGKHWQDPGAFSHGFKGVCSVFVTAGFSFGGTELAGLAAAETANPRKSLPPATKQVFWRITLFYIISLTLVGLLVPYNDPSLLGASSVDATASPFVISINNAGIKGLPSVMNCVIMIAVLSVGNSGVFAASRTVVSLAEQGFAPKWFGYIDRAGRPLVGVGIVFLLGLLCFLAATPDEDTVFTWMLSLSGLSSFFTWGSICLCHVRFRLALKQKGRNTGELAFTSQCGVIGSWFGLILVGLIIIAEFWVSLFPTDKADAESFFETWLCVPLIIVMYIGYFVWKKDFCIMIPLSELDIDTGRRELDLDVLRQEIAEEKAYIQSRQWWYRAYKFWC